MAHANFHMAVGMAVGSAITALPVMRAWLRGAAMTRPIARFLAAGYVLGVWALMPNLLSAAGAPAGIHHARWADIFLLHASIDRREDGGLLKGELVLVALLVIQYVVLMAALVRARRRRPATPVSATRP